MAFGLSVTSYARRKAEREAKELASRVRTRDVLDLVKRADDLEGRADFMRARRVAPLEPRPSLSEQRRGLVGERRARASRIEALGNVEALTPEGRQAYEDYIRRTNPLLSEAAIQQRLREPVDRETVERLGPGVREDVRLRTGGRNRLGAAISGELGFRGAYGLYKEAGLPGPERYEDLNPLVRAAGEGAASPLNLVPAVGGGRLAAAAPRAVRPFIDPVVRGGIGQRAAAETAVGAAANVGGVAAAQATEGAPAPVQVAAGLAGGLAGGVAAVGGVRGARAGLRAADEAIGTRLPGEPGRGAARRALGRRGVGEIAGAAERRLPIDEVDELTIPQRGRLQKVRLFHGTRERDLTAELLEPRRPVYEGDIGTGIYLGQTQEAARLYGPHVVEVDAVLQNPLIIDPANRINARWAPGVDTGEYSSVLRNEDVPPFNVKIGGSWHRIRDWEDFRDIGRAAKDAGHDAVVLRNARQFELAKEEVLLFDRGPIERALQASPPTPRSPRTTPPPSIAGGALDDASDAVLDRLTRGEDMGRGLIRLYQGAIGAADDDVRATLRSGNDTLRSLKIGRQIGTARAVKRDDEIVQLFEALHAPSAVAEGRVTVPERLRGVYDELRALTDVEEQATIDFDPDFATRDDYFYRGWRQIDVDPPTGATRAKAGAATPRIGQRPSFQKPRADATFGEILEGGPYTRPDGSTYRLEPLSWNPYEQWAIRRKQGIIFREQQKLIDRLKTFELAVPDDGSLPLKDWRVPHVGPAFEGKPYARVDADGAARPGFTSRWMVPDKVADILESMYPTRPSLGKYGPIDLLKQFDNVAFASKRAKLFGSLFQQVDFTTRTGFSAFHAATLDLARGRPLSAVRDLLRFPRTVTRIVKANLSPGYRRRLADQIRSTDPILPNRPGVHLRGVREAGWSTVDMTILPQNFRDAADAAIRDAASSGAADAGMLRRAAQRAEQIEKAMQRGLFDGVYPSAQIETIRNVIAPVVARRFPDYTDEQLNAVIARLANMQFSTLPEWQTVISNRNMRAVLHRALFSTNEQEALIRQALGAVGGPDTGYWRGYWLGGFLFLATTANLIHWATTGEPLPFERYNPLQKTPYGPLPVGLRRELFAPNIPLRGRGGSEVTLDLLGQMDTALRLLDPKSFIEARFSTPIRTLRNQWEGKDFYDNEASGPWGRTRLLLDDLFAPIGAGSVVQGLRQKVPGLAEAVPPGESRLGFVPSLLQATGLNLRAETTPQIKDRYAQERFGKPWDELSPSERREIEESAPELVKELGQRTAEAAEQGRESAVKKQLADETKAKYAAEQEGDDQLFRDDALAPAEWRSRRRLRLKGRADALDVVYGGVPPSEPKTALDRYYVELKRLEAEDNGILTDESWDRLDAWVEAQDETDQKYIADNTGLDGTELEQEYRALTKQLDDTGFFDRDRIAWEAVQHYAPPEAAFVRDFDSYGAYRKEAIRQLMRVLGERGVPEYRLGQEAEEALRKQPPEKWMVNARRQYERQWMTHNPELAFAAVEWDLLSLDEDEEKGLDRLLGVGTR